VKGLSGLLWLGSAVAALVAVSGCDALLGPPLEPVAALVAIEVPGEGIARVGPVDLNSGETIHLRAVLEGREDNRTVYYSEARRLEIAGVEVSADSLRPWPSKPIRCLWHTLEGVGPYIEIKASEQLAGLHFINFSHPDWGVACSALATISARQRETMTVPDDQRTLAFGQQNYQVWVELFDKESDLVSRQSFKSPGSDELMARPENFSRVHMKLPGRLAKAASVFGLSQLEPAGDLPEVVREQILTLDRRGLFFSRRPLLRDLIAAGGEHLAWRLIELDGERAFLTDDEEASVNTDRGGLRSGDLLRIGGRVVVLFRDVGRPGVVDGDDLCFDYERGAVVRRLADVFVGEGEVEWASFP